jgi:hypothetical protein
MLSRDVQYRRLQENNNDYKDTLRLPRQVSWIGKQPFANLGDIRHCKADELNDTTVLTTKGQGLMFR